MNRFCLAAVTLIALAASPLARAVEPLEAGIAFVEITPPTPFRMSGYFYERLSTGTKDPLYARAIVFRQGKETAAFVFCDLVGVTREISGPARERASHDSGIRVVHLAVNG